MICNNIVFTDYFTIPWVSIIQWHAKTLTAIHFKITKLVIRLAIVFEVYCIFIQYVVKK